MARLGIATFLLLIHIVLADEQPEVNATLLHDTYKKLDWSAFNITVENENIMRQRTRELEQKLIDDVAVRGTPMKEYRIELRQMNLFMRQHHSIMRTRVGFNLYPLILALDVDHDKRLSGVGSEYVLYLRNGTVRHMKPTPGEYEVNKDLAHIALGIFSIISPYFKNPTATAWQKTLRDYQDLIRSNLIALEASGLNNTFSRLCDDNLTVEDQNIMLTMANGYIESCLKRKSVDIESYKNFTRHYRPYLQRGLKCAAQMQVRAGIAALGKWKDQLGPMWRDVYVVIPVIWPVARINPRQLIFESILDEDKKITNIIKAEGITTIAQARELLGRVVADRSLAHFVFGGSRNLNDTDSNLSLSTRRDIAASYGNEAFIPKMSLVPTPGGLMPISFQSWDDVSANDLRYDEDGPPE